MLNIFLFIISLLVIAVILFLVTFVAWMIWSTGILNRYEYIFHWYSVPLFFINMWQKFTGEIDDINCLGFVLGGFSKGFHVWDDNWEVFFSRRLFSNDGEIKSGDIIIYLSKGKLVHVGRLFENKKDKFVVLSKLGKGGYYALCSNTILKMKFEADEYKLVLLRDDWNLGVASSKFLQNRDLYNRIKSKIR